MASYVIGDIHGCYRELSLLLETINFNPKADKAIFVGDLIGRGPEPSQTLKLIMSLHNSAICVLGNHEIKFLSALYGHLSMSADDNYNKIVRDIDIDTYVNWVSTFKLFYHHKINNSIIVHAGIPPLWSISEAVEQAELFEKIKETYGMEYVIKCLASGECFTWRNNLSDKEKLQYITFGFTRIKFCYNDYTFDKEYQSAPGKQPASLIPWFNLRKAEKNQGTQIIFGHWAALGFWKHRNYLCCDSGCVWGGSLTAIKLEDNNFQYSILSTSTTNSLILNYG